MDEKQLLCGFEEKYPFLYDIQVNGVPLYTCLRDEVLRLLQDGGQSATPSVIEPNKGRIYPRRIVDTLFKIIKNRKRKSLIFTSSMYRRDHGRNLAAEYLMDRYPDSVVFEWPSRNEAYDSAYFRDAKRNRYVPLDGYVVLMKAYRKICKHKEVRLEEEKRSQLMALFSNAPDPTDENERAAVEMLKEKLPVSCAQTQLSHEIFGWLFRNYKLTDVAVDFWGSARENIIPILPNEVQSVELQHGIITSEHPGYIYPSFVKRNGSTFFERKLLVYGEKTKELLTKQSIFKEEKIEVVGNPRIIEYRKQFDSAEQERKLILFVSQPYEQDGLGYGFYSNAIDFLKAINQLIKKDSKWSNYRLGVKLHPRENDGAISIYRNALPEIELFDKNAELYQLLTEAFVQVTVSSTSLYEAAVFNTPTICIRYIHKDLSAIFGFEPWIAESPKDIARIFVMLAENNKKNKYLNYLKSMTCSYM